MILIPQPHPRRCCAPSSVAPAAGVLPPV